MNTVEMPDRLAENLIAFIRDNHGKLSKRRRDGEFRELTDKEVERVIEEVLNWAANREALSHQAV